MITDDKFLLIRNYDLWSDLSDMEYEELNIIHHFIEAKKGEYLYFEPAHLNKLYFVKDGYIKIGYIDDEGNEIIKEIINAGEVFGQFSLMKNDLNGEFAQAYKADVSLCAFNIEDFEKLLETKPQLALKYSKKVGHKLRQVENRLVSMLNKDVRARIQFFFLQLIDQNPDAITNDRFEIENFLTHEDMARLVGAARQTVTTILGEFESLNLVKVNRQKITIPSVKHLSEYNPLKQ